jgi:predicted aldo/keto reductase-like oxidoreductase
MSGKAATATLDSASFTPFTTSRGTRPKVSHHRARGNVMATLNQLSSNIQAAMDHGSNLLDQALTGIDNGSMSMGEALKNITTANNIINIAKNAEDQNEKQDKN